MDGMISGSKESYIPIFVISRKNPIAVTCVGMTLLNGKKKQKILPEDSSRTLLNTKEMLPVKLWFPLVLRNKNKTAEIKLFKSLYKRTPQNCGVLFLCRNASAWQSRWSTLRPLPCGGEFVVSRYILHLSYLKIRLL